MRCPKENVIGGVNNGWKVAMTTLGFERGTSATTGYRRFLKEFNEILAVAQARGANSDPLIRQRLARSWSKIKIMEINGYRTLTDALHGTHTTAALGACNKMFWSEAHQETMLLAMDILGHDGQILLGDDGRGPLLPGRAAGAGRLPRQQPAVALLLLPLGDDLGRVGRDPAQHRGRAGARPAQGAQAGLRGDQPGGSAPAPRDQRGLVVHGDAATGLVDLRGADRPAAPASWAGGSVWWSLWVPASSTHSALE